MSDATPVASSATPDVPVVAPPSALDLAVQSGDVGAFRAARAAERAGKPLPTPSADQSADAAPAEPVEQAASTEASPTPASEPGKTGHKGNADTRIQELLADRARERERAERLERELTEYRQRSQPQPTKPAEPAPATADPEPTLQQFEADPDKYPDPYAAYLSAKARWDARQEYTRLRAEETRERDAQERQKAEQTRIQTFQQRMTEAGGETFLAAISDDVKALRTIEQAQVAGLPLSPLNAVASELIDSDVAPLLMQHWTDHPEDLRKLGAAPNPRALLREFGRQEALVTVKREAPPPAPPKVITTAPPPPTTVGSKPTGETDPLEAAVRSDDVRAFRAQKQRERLAQLR